jgi:hypothetical protein
MTSNRALAVAICCIASSVAIAAHAEEVHVAVAAVAYETGQAAPLLELRSIAEDGAAWRMAINGWTLSLARERAIERGRRVVVSVTATPHDAHSSLRMYRDGARASDLEFNDAALAVRGGLRIRESEHASFEPSLVAGYERLGSSAPRALRDRWSSPYAGVALTQRIRFVTADDPITGRIDGVDVAATVDAYRGNHTRASTLIAENAGRSFGRVHLRQSFAAFGGSGLDTVSAFLVGGSWDVLGPLAIYGRRYAEFRVRSGATFSAGGDIAVTRWLDAGLRGSAFRGDTRRATGAMFALTAHARGLHVTAGAGRSGGRTVVTAMAGGAMFGR